MSDRKYIRHRVLESVADFEESDATWFIVYFGCTHPKTTHRAFLVSWQYMLLKRFIDRGWIWEAKRIEQTGDHRTTAADGATV